MICRLHDRNLDLKFWNFHTKVWLRSRNLLKKVETVATFSWITLKFQIFSWDKYNFSESLGCKLTENYDESSLLFQRMVKQSKKVWHPTCLETNFIFIPNFPQISTKYAPKNQKRTRFHEFNQFWWIFNILYVLCLGLLTKYLFLKALIVHFAEFKMKIENCPKLPATTV
jgi:hypothetical protein